MSPAHTITADTGRQRLSLALLAAAAAEIGAAVVVGAILITASRPTGASGRDHSGHDGHAGHGAHTPEMAPHGAATWQWSFPATIAATVAVVALLWWIASRTKVAAVLAAAGLVAMAMSEPLRGLALHSHLIAMLVLEVLMVGVPLLVLSALPRTHRMSAKTSPVGIASLVGVVVLNSTFLVMLHLPVVHDRTADLMSVPLGVVGLATVIGLSYWAAILCTGAVASARARRTALIIGQEVSAVLGLAALLLPSPYMNHANIFGISSTTDQRLGGLVMLVTCAAVTLPLARRLAARTGSASEPTSDTFHHRTELP